MLQKDFLLYDPIKEFSAAESPHQAIRLSCASCYFMEQKPDNWGTVGNDNPVTFVM